MSIATWKKEFYPSDAHRAKTRLGAVKHSLRKWRGLRWENLERHGITKMVRSIRDEAGAIFMVEDTTCALCALFWNSSEGFCTDCPIVRVLGKRCDQGEDNCYNAWSDDGDPEPMINALERALALVKKEE